MNPWRELTDHEKATSLEQIDSTMTFTETELSSKLELIIVRQENAALAELKAMYRAGQDVTNLVIRHKDEYAKAIAASLTDAIHKGYDIAAKDLKIGKKQLPHLVPYVKQIAQIYADKAAMDLKFMMLLSYLQLVIGKEARSEEAQS